MLYKLRNSARLEREVKTIKAMIEIYCQNQHKTTVLCQECEEIYNYANYRISKCPHKEEKPSCTKCEIHCFNSIMKEKIKSIMKYSGPRMLFYHPVLSLFHYFDNTKDGSLNKSKKISNQQLK